MPGKKYKIIPCMIVGALLLLVSSGFPARATASEEKAVRAVLDQIFDAMRAGDSGPLKTLILPDAPLDRIMPGKPLHHGDLSKWTAWVDGLQPGQADEQIFDVKINVEGALASAWAPFTIALDGELKSCGVNHFTLVKLDDAWKVSALIDTHTPEKCPTK